MRILLLTVIMIFANTAFAGLYKWVDEEGNVHYSQKRPANQQFKRLKAPPPAPSPAPASGKTINKSNEPTAKSSNTAATETAKNEKIRADNCAKAKKNLNNFQIHRRMRDKDGNVTIIDDKERASQIENAKQAISNYCD